MSKPKKIRLLFLAAFLTGFTSGCATTYSYYHWGKYESLLYDMYSKPGNTSPGEQIQKITADILEAKKIGKPIPPGLYAHLGMMYAANGNLSDAKSALKEEKLLYPDSSVFIDGMLARVEENEKNSK